MEFRANIGDLHSRRAQDNNNNNNSEELREELAWALRLCRITHRTGIAQHEIQKRI